MRSYIVVVFLEHSILTVTAERELEVAVFRYARNYLTNGKVHRTVSVATLLPTPFSMHPPTRYSKQLAHALDNEMRPGKKKLAYRIRVRSKCSNWQPSVV